MANTKADKHTAAEDNAQRRRIIEFLQKETAGDAGAESRSACVDVMGIGKSTRWFETCDVAQLHGEFEIRR
jgi:hypothetical protein